MIGAIVLTEKENLESKRQEMSDQINKDYNTTIHLTNSKE